MALDYIRDLSIRASARMRRHALSGVINRKSPGALARCKTQSLILDEPTQAWHVGAKSEIHKIIRSLAKKRSGSSYDFQRPPQVLGMSDRIAVMRAGASPRCAREIGRAPRSWLPLLAKKESANERYFRELSVAGALAILLLVLAIFAPHFIHQPIGSHSPASGGGKPGGRVRMALIIISRPNHLSRCLPFAAFAPDCSRDALLEGRRRLNFHRGNFRSL